MTMIALRLQRSINCRPQGVKLYEFDSSLNLRLEAVDGYYLTYENYLLDCDFVCPYKLDIGSVPWKHLFLDSWIINFVKSKAI